MRKQSIMSCRASSARRYAHPHQASACDRERRCLQESCGIEQQGRALQDAEGADGMHAGVHASPGHYGTDGESALFFVFFYAYRMNTLYVAIYHTLATVPGM